MRIRWGGETGWQSKCIEEETDVYGESIYTKQVGGFWYLPNLPAVADIRFQFSGNGHQPKFILRSLTSYKADQYIGFGTIEMECSRRPTSIRYC